MEFYSTRYAVSGLGGFGDSEPKAGSNVAGAARRTSVTKRSSGGAFGDGWGRRKPCFTRVPGRPRTMRTSFKPLHAAQVHGEAFVALRSLQVLRFRLSLVDGSNRNIT